MNYDLDIQVYGERGILISWPKLISKSISKELLGVKSYLEKLYGNKLIDTSNGYNSVLLLFKEKVGLKLVKRIKEELVYWEPQEEEGNFKIWTIPVCYDFDFGIDLKEYLELKEISISKLIALHSQQEYHVYGKGFLPGFLYLGGLNKQLHLPRKEVPALQIPKNSVAIGGEQTGIYPSASPGGWHIIGKTPITLFNINRKPSIPIQAGDSILFQAISKDDFYAIESSGYPLNFLKTIE